MKKQITLSKDLHLTYEAITRRIAIMGMSGSGKSNTACVLVENLLTIGAQTVILDNDGTWYGVRLNADGKTKGFDIPVFGGLHGDYPLDYRSGALIASIIVENNLSCILDVSDFRKGQRRQFATDLAEQLFHLKKSHKTPMMFVIEEAQEFIPQRVGKEEARMVGAFEDITKGGRKYGVGTTIISQRPQAINKDALNQCEILIAHYTYGNHERKALADWIVDKGQNIDLVNELTTLEEGEAYLWSPRWLKEMKRVQIYKKATFDAAQTPMFGEKLIATTIDKIKLDKIAEMMKSAIESAEDNDPKALKRRIVELEKQLNSRPIVEGPEIRTEYVDRYIISDDQIAGLKEAADKLVTVSKNYENSAALIQGEAYEISKTVLVINTAIEDYKKSAGKVSEKFIIDSIKHDRTPPPARVHTVDRVLTVSSNGDKLRGGELKVLIACAQHPDGIQKDHLMALVDYRRTSINTFIGNLSRKGYLIVSADKIWITDTGKEALGDDYEPLPTGDELRNYWHNRLSGGERGVFDLVVSAYPNSVSKDLIEETTGYKKTSVNTFVGNLVRKRLIVDAGNRSISASDNLF